MTNLYLVGLPGNISRRSRNCKLAGPVDIRVTGRAVIFTGRARKTRRRSRGERFHSADNKIIRAENQQATSDCDYHYCQFHFYSYLIHLVKI